MENPFLEDAIYCLRRASRALSVGMDRDSFYDAALYYAFGMEKLFKAIVYSVNPVFLLESNGFENAVYALYGEPPDRSSAEEGGEGCQSQSDSVSSIHAASG